jgi:type I restriction enzyme, S subunit
MYWGLAMLSREPDFEAMGAGSTGQTELGRSRIAGTLIVVPPLDLQTRFDHIVSPMRSMIPVLETHTANLRAARDLLLPRLISGQIDVDNLNVGLSEAA